MAQASPPGGLLESSVYSIISGAPGASLQTACLSAAGVDSARDRYGSHSPPPMAPDQRTIELGTVLVIGGCGFLGSHIVDQLLNFPTETDPSAALPRPQGDPRFEYPRLRDRFPKYKAKVAVVDLRTTHNRLPGAEYHDGDITSAESMLAVFRRVKPDVVIHTASPSMLDGNKAPLHKVNVEGTRTLLEVAGGAKGDWGGKCKAFVYTSSSSVVHDTQSDLINVNEEWPYVRGKLQQEYYSETKVIPANIRAVALYPPQQRC